MMLTLKIGMGSAKTYNKIADYYENELLDYRKADKVYRIGIDELDDSTSDDLSESVNRTQTGKLSKELRTLESLYERFCERMKRRN
jgi:hypothetical protein